MSNDPYAALYQDDAPPSAAPAPGQPSAANMQTATIASATDPYSQLYEETPQMAPEVSSSGQTQEPLPGWNKAYHAFASRWTLGTAALSRGAAGWQLATTDMTPEEAKKNVETQDLIQTQSEAEDYANHHGFAQIAGMKITGADVAGGWLTEQLPSLAVAGAGAVGGAMLGAAFGVPALGLAAGGALAFGVMMGGQTMYDLTQRGVDKDTAKAGALASGIAGAALGLVGAGAAGKGAAQTAEAILTSAGAKAALMAVTAKLAESMAYQVGSQEANSLVDSTIKYISTRTSKGATPYSVQEATEDFMKSSVQALVIAPQVTGMMGLTGKMAGSRAKAVQDQIDMNTRKYKEEQVQADMRNLDVQPEVKEAEGERVVHGQVVAKRNLRGYVEAEPAPELSKAQQDLAEAKATLAASVGKGDRAYAQLDVDHKTAQLKETQLKGRLEDLEEAITNPDQKPELKEALEKQKARIQKQADKVRLDSAQAGLKKKMAQRERTIQQLRAEIRDDKEQARLNGGVAETAEKRDRLEQLREQQDLDEMLHQMFVEKIVQPDEVAYIRPQVPGKRLQGIVEVAKRQVNNAAKAGEAQQKLIATNIRKLLGAAVDATRLPREDKLTLKNRLSKVQTFAQLEKVFPELQMQFDDALFKRRLAAAHKDLDNVLDTINPKKGTPSKYPSTEEALVAIKEFVRDPEAINRFEIEYTHKEELTPLDEMKFELAELFEKDVDSMTPEEIEKIIDTVVELKEQGKTEALRRFQLKTARQARNEEFFWKHATINPKGKQVSKTAVSSTLFKVLSADPFKVVGRTWRGLMYMITQRGTLNDMRDVFNLKDANSKAWKLNTKWRERFKELVKEHGVDDKAYFKAFNTGEKVSEDLTYTKTNLETGILEKRRLENPKTGENYKLWELLQLRNYLHDHDPDAISRFTLGNEHSYPGTVPHGSSTLEVIESYLNNEAPDLIKIGDAMREFYSPKEFGKVVDETIYRRWGRRITPNETYGGPLVSGASLDNLTRESFRRMTLRPGSMLERQGGGKRVEIRNAFDVLDQHLTSFARESAMLEFEQDAQALFGKQEVRDFITRNYGEKTMKVLDKYIKDIINGPREVEDIISRWVSFFRRKAFTMYLGGRTDQYIKQLTGFVHALQVSSPNEVIDGWSYMFANPKKAIELMNKSPLLKNRKQLLDPDWKPAKPGSLDSIANLTMKGVEAGDIPSVYLSSFPALLAELRKTGSEEKAISAFEHAFETTQGSASIDEQPHFYRSGIFMRMMGIFTQQANRQVEMINVSWDQFVNDPSPKSFGNFMRMTTVSYLGATLYPLAGWLVTAPMMTMEKADKKLAEILAVAPLGPFASLPIWGLVLVPVMSEIMGSVFNQKIEGHEPRALDTDIMGDFVKTGHAALGAGTGDSKQVWNAIYASASIIGHFTGLPLTNMLNSIAPFTGAKE